MKLSKIKTKKEVVNTALEYYIKLLKRVEITKLRWKITFFEGHEKEVVFDPTRLSPTRIYINSIVPATLQQR